jgi:endonuclease G
MAKRPSRSSRSNPKDADLKAALRRYVRAKGAELLKDPNVTSVGVGRKNGDGVISLVFTVGTKAEISQLESLDTNEIPKSIQVEEFTVPTDVVERSFKPSYQLVAAESPSIRKSRVDPLFPGISVSHTDGTAGTIGMVVFDGETGVP